MEKVDKVRQEALKILIKVFEQESYSNILIKNLGQKFDALDRAFISEIVYGTIKYKLNIDYIISKFSNLKVNKISPPILCILRMGIYQIKFMTKVPQSAAVNESVKLARKYGNPGTVKYVNAVLRNYCRNINKNIYPDRNENAIEYLSVIYSCPKWLVERIVNQFGVDFTEDFLRASNEVPPLTIRVNSLKTDKIKLKESLSKEGINVSDGIYLDNALILNNVPGIGNIDEYSKGNFTVQDESSMMAVKVLDPHPGELVMDLCSAPGTKSTYIAELMENRGKVISGDVSSSKLKLVRENAERLGIKIIDTICNDASVFIPGYEAKADRVLLDVPCSGLGIMRKKPEIRWNRSINDISTISNIQKSILKTCSSYVKVGGVLVYSTCTILKEENTEIIQDFLKNNNNFVVEDITELIPSKLRKESCKNGYIEIYPNSDGIDGFFISRLRRVG